MGWDRTERDGTGRYGMILGFLQRQTSFFVTYSLLSQTNRIYHRSLIQTEQSQPKGKRIMLEMKFSDFPALSIGPRVGISGSALETHD